MIRIAGVDLPKKKSILIGLTHIHGIGRSASHKILTVAEIDENKKIDKITDAEAVAIQAATSKWKTEGEVRRSTRLNIKRLMEIGCYRGIRHRKGLPVRGQITQKNARTCKGPRKTVANKKKSVSKT